MAFILGGVLGGFGVYRLMPKPVPQVITVESVKTDIKYKTRIVTLPDGTKTEVTEGEAKQASVSSNSPTKARYAVALSGIKRIDLITLEARLGDLPVFLGVNADIRNLNESKLQLKWEF